MKTKIALAAALLAGLAPVAAASAQSLPQLSVELRAGLPFPLSGLRQTRDELEHSLRPKDSVGGRIVLHATPALDLYLGYTRNRFRLEGFDDVGLDDRGPSAGMRADLPPLLGVTPRIGGGIVRHRAHVVGGRTQTAEGSTALGFEAAGEAEVPVFGRLSVTPGVAYVRYFTDEGFGWFDVTYLRADVGVRYRL